MSEINLEGANEKDIQAFLKHLQGPKPIASQQPMTIPEKLDSLPNIVSHLWAVEGDGVLKLIYPSPGFFLEGKKVIGVLWCWPYLAQKLANSTLIPPQTT